MLLVVGMCSALRIDGTLRRSLPPKSITTAIAIGISEERSRNFHRATVAAVIITGGMGAIVANLVFRLLHIKNLVAQDLPSARPPHMLSERQKH